MVPGNHRNSDWNDAGVGYLKMSNHKLVWVIGDVYDELNGINILTCRISAPQCYEGEEVRFGYEKAGYENDMDMRRLDMRMLRPYNRPSPYVKGSAFHHWLFSSSLFFYHPSLSTGEPGLSDSFCMPEAGLSFVSHHQVPKGGCNMSICKEWYQRDP